MALQQKERLLSLANVHRLVFKDLDGRRVLYILDAPYEFEEIIYRWLSELPSTYKDPASEHCILIKGKLGTALTEEGWGQFIRWMTRTIWEVLNGQRPHIPIPNGDMRLQPNFFEENP